MNVKRLLGSLVLSLVVAFSLLVLIALDTDKTFEWILSRLLGLDFLWVLYSLGQWAKATDRLNDLFVYAVLGEFLVHLLDATAFRLSLIHI